MFYNYNGQNYLLNLIDTPGHVDFSYEVSRSLAACEGTILLVDAAQGIQAQTVANFYLAFSEGLSILPVLNKVDLPNADANAVKKQLETAFEITNQTIPGISAKSGLGIPLLLHDIIEKIPPPLGDNSLPFHALLFDSWYDTYVGVICLVSVKNGIVRKGNFLIFKGVNVIE